MSIRTSSPSLSIPDDSLAPTDEFIMVDQPYDIPLRRRSARLQSNDPENNDCTVEVHPLPNNDAFIVSVRPPTVPEDGLKRASCDIVLVIDVSGSMEAAAPLPDVEDEIERDSAGLSILDLTKHAARTILKTLDSKDRLGIVTFSDDAKVIQELTPMTSTLKTTTWKRIDSLREESCTNLWAGIRTGLDVFERATHTGNVQGLFVLTDGMPNHMCPKQGYVAKLRPILEKPTDERHPLPTIHTFGFGYSIRSQLMQSIAEVGHGNFSFIPDAGMIGTVFVHAVANLFTTYANSALLEVHVSSTTRLAAVGGVKGGEEGSSLTLNLGNVQYGQSRDLMIKCPGMPEDTAITAALRYTVADGSQFNLHGRALFSETTAMPSEMIEYHTFRNELCEFLSSLFPIGSNGEHTAITRTEDLATATERLGGLVKAIQSSLCRDTPHVKSLLEDLEGNEPIGQVSKALLSSSTKNYWKKWGHHYLPSLLHAHQRQVCNSFKDPGPLLYGKDSPLFIACRDELDAAFDNLPAPKPSRPERVVITYSKDGQMTGTATRPHTRVSMSSYNSAKAPCFEGNSKIRIGHGGRIAIKTLKPGMRVWTPTGIRRVAAVLKTRVRNGHGQLCRVGELLVTPWHPIQYRGQWVFPNEVVEDVLPFTGWVFSVLLAPAIQADSHAIEVGGQVCVTLGHGIEGDETDVRSHPFFGHYRKVVKALSRLQKDQGGRLRCAGLQRDQRTGLACGFVGTVAVRNTPNAGVRKGASKILFSGGKGVVGRQVVKA